MSKATETTDSPSSSLSKKKKTLPSSVILKHALVIFWSVATIIHVGKIIRREEDAIDPLAVVTRAMTMTMTVSNNSDIGGELKQGCPGIDFGNEINHLLKRYKHKFITPESAANTTREESVAGSMNGTDGPRLFIHVGPIKTGSSSIQCNLMVNPFLGESSYDFMGKYERLCAATNLRPTRSKYFDVQELVFRYIIRGWLGQTNKTEVFHDYVTRLTTTFRNNFDKGLNTILSGEEFCGLLELDRDPHGFLQHFANLLNDVPQSIIFQVVYRHNFDWALSIYQFGETHEKRSERSMNKKTMDSILDHKAFFLEDPPPKCSPHILWKFLGERLIPLLDRAKIEVFNFHGDGEDIATRYICNLPGAQVACQKTRENLRLKPANPTNVDLLHSDRIATDAWKQEMYANSSELLENRWEIREKIIHHFRNELNSTFTDLPLECLSEQEFIKSLDLSLSIGKAMLGKNLDVEALICKFLRILSCLVTPLKNTR